MLEYLLTNYYAACVLVIIAMAFAFAMQFKVKRTFEKYNKVRSLNGIKACDVARQILDANGLTGVGVVRVSGSLTDHYDPAANTVALSDNVYDSTSVSAIGVTAHECGHAIQHAEGYMPVKIRTAIFPAVNIASRSWIALFFLGIIFSFGPLVTLGIIFFSFVVVFQTVTLPVEFNASYRALETIKNEGFLTPEEQIGAKRTLGAAAMTYIASLALSLAQLIRLLAQSNRRR